MLHVRQERYQLVTLFVFFICFSVLDIFSSMFFFIVLEPVMDITNPNFVLLC
uniref:Uncharacterized protein n=1 Tax=Rhizophora mucronata TaxID=61149 RepID=A0A2P2KI34_RHIMU